MTQYSIRETMDDDIRESLSGYSPLLQDLLFYRGIVSKKEAELFLNPDYDAQTHDPFLMKGMDRAVSRILSAIKGNEKIVIYSDYDCDGIPGGVLLHDFFKAIGYSNFVNYIPHRHDEGYGLNRDAVDTFAKDGAALIITVDCGISDVIPVEQANKQGIDVIVTDHHLPDDTLPPAYVILNPKQEDDKYPFDMLCGSGVAYKLVQALLSKDRFGLKVGWEKWWLDMVGIATISDMVPLIGENRVLAHFGLQVLRKSPRVGLMKLCRVLYIDQRKLTEDDIGFMISPRINAASRMETPMDAFRLLTTSDEVEAGELAKHLNKINDKRKGLVASMKREVNGRIKSIGELRDVIVLGNPKWRPGLLGLVANSVAEEYKRPVFLWGREGVSIIKGSCRSDGNVNIVELMAESRESFIDFGGHKFSGGFSVDQEHIHHLEEKLIEAYKKIGVEVPDQNILVDKQLSLGDVNWKTFRSIRSLAPFGTGNPKPLFLFKDVTVSSLRRFGRDKAHLELSLEDKDGNKTIAISFFVKDDNLNALAEGSCIDLIGTMEQSSFRKIIKLQLYIVDIIIRNR